jgi:hypothetical protein
MVYAKHQEALAKCDKLAGETGNGIIGSMKALERGDVLGGVGGIQGAQGPYEQFMECRSKLNAAIKADLTSARLEEKDWFAYLERRKKDAAVRQGPTK